MDVLEHLIEEHRKVEGLLAQLADTEEGDERAELVRQVTDALEVHMAVEERFVYPLVAEVMGDEPEEEAEAEHGLTREGIAKLEAMQDEPGFGAAVDMVRAGIQHHVHEEESEVFPGLRSQAADQLAAMDPDDLEQRVRSDGSSSRGTTGRRRSGGPVLDLTKEELYEEAKKADIPGRSSMSKEELAEALGKT